MRSPLSRWLLAKDIRELAHSRSWWILLLAAGLLAGHAFVDGVEAYGEMSGVDGGPAALAQGLSPLDGIVVPTLGTLSLVAMLLLPFVVIRLVAHERRNGAWTLLVQGPQRVVTLVWSKVIVLLGAWLLVLAPSLLALALWRSADNHLDARETFAVLLGQLLFAWITIGVASAAAAIMDGEANAAIVALGFTIGSWALEVVGAARGGALSLVAGFTPGAMLQSFEHGLVQLNAMVVAVLLGLASVAVAAVWLAPARRSGQRQLATLGIALAALVGCLGAARLRPSWDLSEDRRNSFAPADERALQAIGQPIRVDIHLAQEDPRLEDLRRGVLDKLHRILPATEINYVARTRTGLFEQTDSLYGTITWQVGARRVASRSVTAPIVLDEIYQLAGVAAPPPATDAYPGYPLVKRPEAIIPVFFIGWPLLILAALGALHQNRRSEPS